jgi:hypothetical protein
MSRSFQTCNKNIFIARAKDNISHGQRCSIDLTDLADIFNNEPTNEHVQSLDQSLFLLISSLVRSSSSRQKEKTK